jgi:hypothetical protein
MISRRRSMRLSKKYSNYLFVGIMAAMMSLTMSLVMTYVAIGMIKDFLQIWANSFFISLLVSYPTALLVLPVARNIVNRVSE